MTKDLKLPVGIVQAISEGKAILFLGAGASYGAMSNDGKLKARSGDELAIAISDRFLEGKRRNDSLAKVAGFAITQHSTLDVQIYVRELFDSLEPADFHRLIPHFRWKAIITTNYDRIVEKSYAQATDRLQNPHVVIANGDMRGLVDVNNAVPILKLHGCISRATDTSLPLILANEQYAKHKAGRERLSTWFIEQAKDYPVIFCGYDLGDAHISQILFSLEEGFKDRQLYASINPSLDELDRTYWANFRLEAITGTFENFLTSIDHSIPKQTRLLGGLLSGSAGSLSKWLKVGASASNGLQAILGSRLLHVHRAMPVENPKSEKFYRGESASWSPIASDLDFRRSIAYQVIASSRTDATAGTQFILVKGHAGSGKSVLLKRIGWELCGPGYGALVFFSDSSMGGIRDVLEELCVITGSRIFILIDDALLDSAHLNDCVTHSQKLDLPVTFLAGARGNEWNIAQKAAHVSSSDEYTLGDLSSDEALDLVRLLKAHSCLGELKRLSEPEQVARLMERNERQLLVALHEATLGVNNFRKLLLDEYRNIVPPEARILYLDICSLHRLQVAVRAGLISRMSGTSFHTFQSSFFSPLERVVSVFSDPMSRDFAYRSRHAEIARIVFEEALPNPEDRANQMARVMGALNTDFSSDDRVASLLLKGKLLADEFADRSLVERIFNAAEQSGIDRSFVLQQRALFELNHPGGSSQRAMRLIDEAIGIAKKTGALHHTKAVVLRTLAREPGIDRVLADRFREHALSELRDHGQVKSSKYGITTYCEILLDQVKDRLNGAEDDAQIGLTGEVVVRKMSDLERFLSEALQRYPDDTYVSALRAELFNVLDKNPRALATLRAAFEKLPSNEAVALRLARQLMDTGSDQDANEALGVLRRAVGLNAASKSLSYQLARLLMGRGELENRDEISTHLRRSFTPGDTHFDAQFWTARHEFLFGERARAIEIYDRFSKRSVPYIDADEKRGLVRGPDAKATDMVGTVKALKGDFGFVYCATLAASVFLHRTQLKQAKWTDLRVGDELKFRVAFSFRGPCCVDCYPA